ncbi:hypothetical protein GWK48_00820 [Metallosphaera tengchongensis]|uniref:ABC transporter ATP-binding protein n=1 Tax=Metallosphaera tengchongensis TaxID=1532350 RepID=A0A6N0NVG6_9CREN|nr:hypothetical protein [Metallosphaera tengchongensis]QKQ99130.1 hypothetical protein GWK48_00820 [Metallosphaera tengchongensis]
MISLKDPSIEVKNVTCILGEWGEDKSNLSLKLRKGIGEIQYLDPYTGAYLSKSEGAKATYVVPREMRRGNMNSKDLLAGWFRSSKRAEEVMFLLDIPDDNLNNISDVNLSKVYMSPLLKENVKFAVIEDFFQLIEEQGKFRALKYLFKILRSKRMDALLMISTTDLLFPCDQIYVMYDGEIVEEGGGLLHPYTMALNNSSTKIGRKGEKLNVVEVGRGSPSGCVFHDYCQFLKVDKVLQRKCRLEKPPMWDLGASKVKCWKYWHQ